MTRHKNLALHAEIAINEIRDTRRVENARQIAAVDDDRPSILIAAKQSSVPP